MSLLFSERRKVMIIVRDVSDIDKLYTCVRRGSVLEIYETHYGVNRIYWEYEGVVLSGWGEGDYMDYCSEAMFFHDILMTLQNGNRYFLKLTTDGNTELVYLDTDSYNNKNEQNMNELRASLKHSL